MRYQHSFDEDEALYALARRTGERKEFIEIKKEIEESGLEFAKHFRPKILPLQQYQRSKQQQGKS